MPIGCYTAGQSDKYDAAKKFDHPFDVLPLFRPGGAGDGGDERGSAESLHEARVQQE